MKINRLQPKLVVVTGAGSGIGRATAVKFAKLGAHVVVSDIDLASADETVAIIRSNGDKASAALLDVTDADAWEQFATAVRSDFGVADVLVNNAGFVLAGAFLDMSPGDWERQLGPNLMGVVWGSRVFGRQMAERGKGHIVNIASAASYNPVPGTSAYNVSKAGVRMLTDCLRVELGPKGVSASSICPGVIRTNLARNAQSAGIDAGLFDRGVDVTQLAGKALDALPFELFGPNLVANAAVRAVRFDLDVVPVRTEAWVTYGLYRIAPSLTRGVLRNFPVDRLEAAGARALALLDRFIPTQAGDPLQSSIADFTANGHAVPSQESFT